MQLPAADGFEPSIAAERKVLRWMGSLTMFLVGAGLLYLYGVTISNDVGEYALTWNAVRGVSFIEAWKAGRFEIGSLFVYYVFAQFLSAALTFYAIGLLTFSIKYHLIRKYLLYPVAAVAVYIVLFLEIHDGNQIRAAMAACLVLYAVVVPPEDRPSYLVLAGIATLFHYSGLLILVLYGLRSPMIGLSSIVVVSFVWDRIVASSPALGFALLYLSQGVGQVNLTSSLFVVQVAISIACALQWKKFSDTQKRGAYLVMSGAVFYVAFIRNPVLAHRLRELSILGVLPVLFSGDTKLRYTFAIIWLGVVYWMAYGAQSVVSELYSTL